MLPKGPIALRCSGACPHLAGRDVLMVTEWW
jgi:hypothetical protein